MTTTAPRSTMKIAHAPRSGHASVHTWPPAAFLQAKCACGASTAASSEPCAACATESEVPIQPATMPGHEFAHLRVQPTGGAGGTVPTKLTMSPRRRRGSILEDGTDGGSHQQGGAGRARGTAPTNVHRVLGSTGRPFDERTRRFFEQRFGHDFGDVRIHDDGEANSSAREIHALAYTVGSHLVFDRGVYAPHNSYGRGVIAHELTHVVQQRHGPGSLSRFVLDSPGEGPHACVTRS
jgi:Domain of unknown function (DUF4157)